MAQVTEPQRSEKAWPEAMWPPVWLAPLLLGLFLMPMRGVDTSPDSAWYLSTALNLEARGAYLDSHLEPAIQRGPVYPVLLGGSFRLFGASVETAFWLARGFMVLNGLLVYFLAARLFGRLVGLGASLLVLASAEVQNWSGRILLDHIQPGLILAALLVVHLAFEGRRQLWFALAGVLMAVAFLTKGSALVFLPLPFLLWLLLPTYRSRRLALGLVVFYLCAAAVIVPWQAHTAINAAAEDPLLARIRVGVLLALGKGNASGADLPSFSLGSWVGELWTASSRYYHRNLTLAVVFPPAIVLAWACLLVRSCFLRCRGSTLLLLSMACFAPIILYLGTVRFRLGQSLLVYMLSFIALAALVTPTRAAWLRSRGLAAARSLALVVYLLAQVFSEDVGLVTLFQGDSETGRIEGRGAYEFCWVRCSWTVGGWHGRALVEAADWFQENTSPDEPILMDWYWADGLFFLMGGRQPIHTLAYARSHDISHTFMSSGPQFDRFPATEPLFLWMQADRTDPTQPGTFVNSMSETRFRGQLAEIAPRYLVLTPPHHFLYLYLKADPDFDEIQRFGTGEVVVFRVGDQPGRTAVTQPKPVDFRRRAADSVPTYLARLSRLAVSGPKDVAQRFLVRELGLETEAVEAITAASWPAVHVGKIYTPQDYALSVHELGSEEATRAVARFEDEWRAQRFNPWTALTLVHLYLASAKFDRTRVLLEQTSDLSMPDSAREEVALAWSALGRSQLRAGRVEAALSSLDSALKRGVDLERSRRSILDLVLNVARTVDSRSGIALLAEYDVAVERVGSDLSTQLDLGDAYATLGAPDRAVGIYDRAMTRWPEQGLPYLHKARVLKQQARVEESIGAYLEALDRLHLSRAPYREAAQLLAAQGAIDEAITLLRGAGRRAPREAWPHLDLGQILMKSARRTIRSEETSAEAPVSGMSPVAVQ